MSNPLNLPFLPGYVPPATDPNLVSQVTKSVENAASAVVTDAEQAVGQAIGAGASPPPSAAPAPIPPPATPATAAPPVTDLGGLVAVIENAAKTSATQAVGGLSGSLELAAEQALDKALGKLISGPPAPPALTDFVHADARSRAARSLVTGLVLSVLWGIVSALGMASNLNWFDKTSWPVLATLLTSSVVTSVTSYVSRLVKEPAHTAPVTQLLASTPPTGGK